MFDNFGSELSYKDILQCDGAFDECHRVYGKAPIFNGQKLEPYNFSGTKNRPEKQSTMLSSTETEFNSETWKHYWLEYINAFDSLSKTLPDSVVTAFVGRHAIEIGLKYLILLQDEKVVLTHGLNALTNQLYKTYNIDYDSYPYMKWVDSFLDAYSENIEHMHFEYFRYPEYKKNQSFTGFELDISWLSYNFSLILLKFLHLAGLDSEILL